MDKWKLTNNPDDRMSDENLQNASNHIGSIMDMGNTGLSTLLGLCACQEAYSRGLEIQKLKDAIQQVLDAWDYDGDRLVGAVWEAKENLLRVLNECQRTTTLSESN